MINRVCLYCDEKFRYTSNVKTRIFAHLAFLPTETLFLKLITHVQRNFKKPGFLGPDAREKWSIVLLSNLCIHKALIYHANIFLAKQ